MIFANVTLVHIADTLEQLDADTETLFGAPKDIRTENYITGRFG